MFFPPQLWTPSPKALAGSVLELITVRTELVTAAAVDLQQNAPAVPLDYIELVHWIGMEYTAGAGQSLIQCGVFHADPVAQLHAIVINNGQGPAQSWGNVDHGQSALLSMISQPVLYVIPPGHFLRWNFTFSAGVQPNNIRGAYQAWRIPRGQVGLLGP